MIYKDDPGENCDICDMSSTTGDCYQDALHEVYQYILKITDKNIKNDLLNILKKREMHYEP